VEVSLSVSTPRSSNRTGSFLASGFRTKLLMRSPTRGCGVFSHRAPPPNVVSGLFSLHKQAEGTKLSRDSGGL